MSDSFNKPPGQQESLPKNLKSNLEETIAAMKRIEGKEWEEQQKKWEQNNITGAIAWLNSTEEFLPHNYIIYGAGGLNRWIVDREGNISFLKDYGRHSIKKAEAEGFEIL